MRIFLTGGTGYLGSHLVQEISGAGHEVTVLTRRPDRAVHLTGLPTVRLVSGDMRGVSDWADQLAGHDALVHNAIVWDDDPTDRDLPDVRASIRLFEAAADARIRHVAYTSSTAVHRPFTPGMSEEARLRPIDYYGATKASTEDFLSAISAQREIIATVVRAGPVVGAPAMAGAPFKSDRTLSAIVEAARRNEEIIIDGNEGRQFVAGRDVAKLYRKILESDQSGTFLAIAQETTPWRWIAEIAIASCGSTSRITVREQTKPDRAWFDASKVEREFGLRFSAEAAIREHIDFLLNSPHR